MELAERAWREIHPPALTLIPRAESLRAQTARRKNSTAPEAPSEVLSMASAWKRDDEVGERGGAGEGQGGRERAELGLGSKCAASQPTLLLCSPWTPM